MGKTLTKIKFDNFPERKNNLALANSSITQEKAAVDKELRKMTLLNKENAEKKDSSLIEGSLINHCILRSLDRQSKQDIITGVSLYSVKANQEIYRQGDSPGCFYILQNGTCDVLINGEKKQRLQKGNIFGETDILFGTNRDCTIKTNSDCNVWAMEKKNLKKFIDHMKSVTSKEINSSIGRSPLFSTVKEDEKSKLFNNSYTETYNQNHTIYDKGCISNCLYILKDGNVDIKKDGKLVNSLKRGDCFGLPEVLANCNRIFQANSKGKTTLITIPVSSLISLYGDNFRSSVALLMIKNAFENNQFLKKVDPKSIDDKILNLFKFKYYDKETDILRAKEHKNFQLVVCLEGELVETNSHKSICSKNNVLFGKEIYDDDESETPSPIKCKPFSVLAIAKYDDVKRQFKGPFNGKGKSVSSGSTGTKKYSAYSGNARNTVPNTSNTSSAHRSVISANLGTSSNLRSNYYTGNTGVKNNLEASTNLRSTRITGEKSNLGNSKNIRNVRNSSNTTSTNISSNLGGTRFTANSSATKKLGASANLGGGAANLRNAFTLGSLYSKGSSNGKKLDLISAIKQLQKVKLFKNFTKAKFENLSSKIKIEQIPDKQNVITEGEEGTRFYIIKKGQVDIFVKGKYIRTMNENEYLGERALFFKEPRSATATAHGDCEVYFLEKEDFETVIEKNLKDYLKDRLYLQDNTVSLEDLEFYMNLGSGSYGNVSLVKSKKNKFFYAIKNMSCKQILYEELHQNLELERAILLKIDHPFIVKLVKTMKDKNYIYFLMDYIKGKELFDVLRDIGQLNKFQTQFYTASIMLAVQYLHERNFIYRDIKPENIMVLGNGFIKLIDFGTAKAIKDKATTLIGTPHYMAPEVILGKGYSFPCDIWSIAIMMYEFICGKVPFGENLEEPMDVYLTVINE